MRRAVDFPQPDGPNKAVNWPAGTSRDILFNAGFFIPTFNNIVENDTFASHTVTSPPVTLNLKQKLNQYNKKITVIFFLNASLFKQVW